jgi:hypothetical protein
LAMASVVVESNPPLSSTTAFCVTMTSLVIVPGGWRNWTMIEPGGWKPQMHADARR